MKTAHEDQDACCAAFACAARPPIQAASKLLTQPREVQGSSATFDAQPMTLNWYAFESRALPGIIRGGVYRGPRVFSRSGHLVLQHKRPDCGTASPVIAALCGQNANRQSEHERGGGDDYAFGHHGSPLGF